MSRKVIKPNTPCSTVIEARMYMANELFQGQSFYEVLGLSQSASGEEVAEAYESKKEELDNLSEIDEVVLQKALTLLERAYGTLSDDNRRAEYDETLEELADADPEHIPGTALREFDSLPEVAEPVLELTEEVENTTEIKSDNTRVPRLSGRLKATVTVPLSTISRAIKEGGDLSFLDDENSSPELSNKQGVIVDRAQLEEQVSSYSAITRTTQMNKIQETHARHTGSIRERKHSLELPRNSVAHLMSEPDEDKKTAFDYFLLFCAFILPVATILLTLIHFLLPNN